MIKHQGGCYCGQVRFTTEFDPMLVMNCHCRTCKKISGANLSSFAAFYESEILNNLHHQEQSLRDTISHPRRNFTQTMENIDDKCC